jgi:hypothetical protein
MRQGGFEMKRTWAKGLESALAATAISLAAVQKVGKALASGDHHKASSYSLDLNHNSNVANNTVLGFGFDYCRVDPSRFS